MQAQSRQARLEQRSNVSVIHELQGVVEGLRLQLTATQEDKGVWEEKFMVLSHTLAGREVEVQRLQVEVQRLQKLVNTLAARMHALCRPLPSKYGRDVGTSPLALAHHATPVDRGRTSTRTPASAQRGHTLLPTHSPIRTPTPAKLPPPSPPSLPSTLVATTLPSLGTPGHHTPPTVAHGGSDENPVSGDVDIPLASTISVKEAVGMCFHTWTHPSTEALHPPLEGLKIASVVQKQQSYRILRAGNVYKALLTLRDADADPLRKARDPLELMEEYVRSKNKGRTDFLGEKLYSKGSTAEGLAATIWA